MSRSYAHMIVKIAATFGIGLLAGGTVMALSTANPALRNAPVNSSLSAAMAANSPAALEAPDRYCYNWDFLNNTGEDATGLNIRLAGIMTYSDVYTGTLNPFGAPDPASGYDAGTNVYTLVFSNGTALAGDPVHIGLCTDQPLLALDPGGATPPFTWLVNGQPSNVHPLFAGLMWHWLSRSHVEVQLTNDPQVSMTLMALNLLDGGDKLPLDDLNADILSQLPLAANLAEDPVSLGPGEAGTVDATFDLSTLPAPNHPYVLEAVLVDDSDTGNMIHLYSQALSPLATTYMPSMRRD